MIRVVQFVRPLYLIALIDVITQIIMFSVIYGLYELSILLVKMVDSKREAQLREDGYYDDEGEDDAPAEAAKADGPILEIVEDDFEADAFDDENKPT